MSNIAYIRTSTTDQHLDRQIEAFKQYNIDKVFSEQVSGKNIKDRPELNKMMEYVREGDIDTITPTGKLVFNILASLAEFERETIKERQAEGIAIAKAKGTYKGKP